MNLQNQDIDVIVLWVDGNDPELVRKRKRYQTKAMEELHEDVGGKTRYADLGEIEYCIASINRFAPFIRKIFIVTDGQNPGLGEMMMRHFPQGQATSGEDFSRGPIPMEIISHEIIFEGYEQYLPSFNSRSIETLIWRIPGLSEKFILMNDDFFFAAPVQPETFFKGNRTNVWATWSDTRRTRLIHRLEHARDGYIRVSFKDSLINAAEIMGEHRRYLYLTHSPRALRKSFFIDFYGVKGNHILKNEEIILRNIRYRFRNNLQYNSQELFYIHEHSLGRLTVRPPGKEVLYLKPRHGIRYMKRKIRHFSNDKERLFGCINSLDTACYEDQCTILHWLNELVYLPHQE